MPPNRSVANNPRVAHQAPQVAVEAVDSIMSPRDFVSRADFKARSLPPRVKLANVAKSVFCLSSVMPRETKESLYVRAATAQWVASAPEDERPNREIAAERIIAVLHKPYAVLYLDSLGLHSLPDCLKELSLCCLQLEENHLRYLPPLPTKTLNKLDVSGNRLQQLPDLPEYLDTLRAKRNRLSTLPPLPPRMRLINLEGNSFTQFPEALLGAQPYCEIFYNTVLSDAELARIRTAYAHYRSQEAPSIYARNGRYKKGEWTPSAPLAIEMYLQEAHERELGDFSPAAMRDAIQAWCGDEARSAPEVLNEDRVAFWSEIVMRAREVDGVVYERAFLGFLNRLHECAEYKKPELRPALVERVVRLLGKIEADADFRTTCFNMATEAIGSCQDRAALVLDDLELAMIAAPAAAGKLGREALLDLALGLFKVDEIEKITLAKARSLESPETIEIQLGLRTQLRHRLQLPTETRELAHLGLSGLSNAEITEAGDLVEALSKDMEKFSEFLVSWQPWCEYLKKNHPSDIAAANGQMATEKAQLQEEMARVITDLETAAATHGYNSHDYYVGTQRMDAVTGSFDRLHERLVKPLLLRLTQVELKTD